MRAMRCCRTFLLPLLFSPWLCAAEAPVPGQAPPPPPARIERQRVQPVQPVAPAQTVQPSREVRPVTPAKPPESVQADASVDLATALKNQWLQCQEDYQQCDTENDGLRQQVQTLKTQIGMQQMQISQLQTKLDETVHPGGSLVKAWCDEDGVSHNTAGDSQQCGYYGCEQVSGLCRTVCDVAEQCHAPVHNANGTTTWFVCDSTNRQCVPSG